MPIYESVKQGRVFHYRIGTHEDSNGLKVRTADGLFVGWVYRTDYIEGHEREWGAISNASSDVGDRTLYKEELANKTEAAEWLLERWFSTTPLGEPRVRRCACANQEGLRLDFPRVD